jgi:hypothetical protein
LFKITNTIDNNKLYDIWEIIKTTHLKEEQVENAFKMKFIDSKKLKVLAKPFGVSSYGKYLKSIVNEN